MYATARGRNDGVDYIIGITGRAEIKNDGNWDPLFNLVRTAADYKRAKALIDSVEKQPAFSAIALNKADNAYTAYFGRLDRATFPRSIPMLPNERGSYRQLADYTPDARVSDFFS